MASRYEQGPPAQVVQAIRGGNASQTCTLEDRMHVEKRVVTKRNCSIFHDFGKKSTTYGLI